MSGDSTFPLRSAQQPGQKNSLHPPYTSPLLRETLKARISLTEEQGYRSLSRTVRTVSRHSDNFIHWLLKAVLFQSAADRSTFDNFQYPAQGEMLIVCILQSLDSIILSD
ncbi:hypothetical protein TNCV_4979581 [Trichonephila clavipes]|nr:hypothetical protein TNCV_4979581 [Trichonephila clavipes]